MSSIKTLLPQITEVLGISQTQAYDRQRVLLAANIFKARPGRGPGSGVKATPRNVALLLLALLVGEFRNQGPSAIRAVAKAIAATGICPITRKTTFLDTVSILIAEGLPDWRMWPSRISLSRDTMAPQIEWPTSGHPMKIDYTIDGKYGSLPGRSLRVVSELDGGALLRLRRILTVNATEKLRDDEND